MENFIRDHAAEKCSKNHDEICAENCKRATNFVAHSANCSHVGRKVRGQRKDNIDKHDCDAGNSNGAIFQHSLNVFALVGLIAFWHLQILLLEKNGDSQHRNADEKRNRNCDAHNSVAFA